MSCLVCLYQCLSFLGCRNCLIKKLAFFPPPDRYQLEESGQYEVKETGVILKTYNLKFFQLDSDDLQQELQETIQTFFLKIPQPQNKKLPPLTAFYCKNKSVPQNKKQIILYSHGNATDLFNMRQILIEMSHQLNSDIFAYDYTGYGDTTSSTSDLLICQNIETVYNFITNQLGYQWYQIILYGQSLGSGPSTFLASNFYTPILGLILHSPISSGARVIEPDIKTTIKRDFFPNIDMIEYVNTPVFIIHGLQDNDIDVSMGQSLYKKCKHGFPPWWVEEAGHNDIHFLYHYDYYLKLNQFLKYLQQQREKYDIEQLLQKYQAANWNPKFDHLYNSKTFRSKAYENKEKNKKQKDKEQSYKVIEMQQ